MINEPLLHNYNQLGEQRNDKGLVRFIGGMALGACVAYIALSATSASQNDDSMQLWLNQPKDEYNWNVTSILQWTSLNLFINLAVSPLGELYGIQKYDD